MTAIEVHGTSVSNSTSPMGRELSHQPEAIQTLKQRRQSLPHVTSTAVTLSVPGRQPWPPPRSSALWTYDGTTDS